MCQLQCSQQAALGRHFPLSISQALEDELLGKSRLGFPEEFALS